jgi:phosphatidylinositol alpha 1,6-mannosyltransferase
MGMRVAIVTESFLPSLNGVTNSVLRVLDTLAAEGHEAIIIAPTAPSTHYKGFTVVRSPAIPFFAFPLGVPNLTLQATLANFNPDVVHVASPFFLGGQAIAAANRLGIPSVAIYQTDIAGYLQRYGFEFARPAVDRAVLAIHNTATLNLAPTPETARYLEALGVPRVKVWGRGVDLELYHPSRKTEIGTLALREKFLGKKDITIGFVGRLAPEKQVHQMRDLFGIRNAAFVVVGDGPERPRLEQEFRKHPVTFTGALRGNDLAQAYGALDVFVHFGTEETFGQTIQEAQATGLPVIAPAAGGPRFLIEHGETGFLADPTRPQTFVDLATQLAEDAQLRNRIGEASRRRVLRNSWEANNERLLAHYRSAILHKTIDMSSTRELV